MVCAALSQNLAPPFSSNLHNCLLDNEGILYIRQNGIVRNFSRSRFLWHWQPIARKQRARRLNVACLGFADIAKRRCLSEVGNHLVLSSPGAVLVVERLIKRVDFGFR